MGKIAPELGVLNFSRQVSSATKSPPPPLYHAQGLMTSAGAESGASHSISLQSTTLFCCQQISKAKHFPPKKTNRYLTEEPLFQNQPPLRVLGALSTSYPPSGAILPFHLTSLKCKPAPRAAIFFRRLHCFVINICATLDIWGVMPFWGTTGTVLQGEIPRENEDGTRCVPARTLVPPQHQNESNRQGTI